MTNKKSKDNSIGNDNSRSLRDDNKKSNSNGNSNGNGNGNNCNNSLQLQAGLFA
jgi:hypothetical protein